ncbi:hypothetical protein GCM10020331_050880 [Ectobacillus funiculus]
MINHIKKEPGFPDLPNLKQLYVVPLWDYRMNVERINDLLSELKKETFFEIDIMTVGEANGVRID